MIKSLPWPDYPPSHPPEHSTAHALERKLRHAVAAVLRGASRVLSRLARRVATTPNRTAASGHLEFYAEAGAPEGAVYVNGLLVGHLTGVKRL
jgi:hypothetical protein